MWYRDRFSSPTRSPGGMYTTHSIPLVRESIFYSPRFRSSKADQDHPWDHELAPGTTHAAPWSLTSISSLRALNQIGLEGSDLAKEDLEASRTPEQRKVFEDMTVTLDALKETADDAPKVTSLVSVHVCKSLHYIIIYHMILIYHSLKIVATCLA